MIRDILHTNIIVFVALLSIFFIADLLTLGAAYIRGIIVICGIIISYILIIFLIIENKDR